MGKVTAVARLNEQVVKGKGEVYQAFNADYSDERNKEWSKFTPSMHLGMTVTSEVAEQFTLGKIYLLTIEEQ